MSDKICTRREFIKLNTIAGVGSTIILGTTPAILARGLTSVYNIKSKDQEPIIDVHQHTNYHGRNNDHLLAHQRAMCITNTILLPAWRPENPNVNLSDASRGVGWKKTGNEVCYRFAQEYTGEFLFGANQVPGHPFTKEGIEIYLKRGARIIGEMKFGVECDSTEMQEIYELAQAYDVPVLMHWQHERYNFGFERFHKMLEKYPKVIFIGHAQTWWANIDKNHKDQSVLFPDGKVTPGGWTDQLLSNYPNMYGDLSAGSGLNALTRDEEHTIGFLERHQDKLLFGSDCADSYGHGPNCQGAQTIEVIRKLSSSKTVERKLLFENAQQLFNL